MLVIYITLYRIAVESIDDAMKSLEEAQKEGNPNRTLTVMETFLQTEGLSKADVATMILDMLFAGVDTVLSEKTYLKSL